MTKISLSSREREILEKELTERLKDIVYMKASEGAKKFIDTLENIDFEDGNEKITFTYEIEFIVNDLLQIIGRERRLRR